MTSPVDESELPSKPPTPSTDSLIQQIKEFWRDGLRPDLRALLNSTNLDHTHLVEVLRADQQCRWQAGEPVSAALYLEHFPELSANAEHAFDLIWSEYLIREKQGQRPELAEFIRAYPPYESLIQRQHEVHQWVEDAEDTRNSLEAGSELRNQTWLQKNSAGLADPQDQATANAESPSLRLPGFEVLGEVGRGGMGVVYRAKQLSLGRDVALKILSPAFATDPARLARFRAEASIAARLMNSRVLPVFDILESNGVPILVMPFVNGWDLARILSDRRDVARGEPAEGRHPSSNLADHQYLRFVLPLLDQVVAAVAAIHEAGVLHRDIKPSNILVDRGGDIRLTDFGLARLSLGPIMTVDGQLMGTPGFMSPEQWAGQTNVDERVDVFGLGITLYQILTLELPYGVRRITRHESLPARPGKGRPHLPAEFDAVILKALDPNPAGRYKTARELREDWCRVREGLPPHARHPGYARRAARSLNRHSWTVANIGAIAFVLLAILAALAQRRATPPMSSVAKAVNILTKPPGAHFALARLDDSSGLPIMERIVRGGDRIVTPARVQLLPGDYLIATRWPDGRFHEVYRHVPGPGEAPSWPRHLNWAEHSGIIDLNPIDIPPVNALDRMAYFEGGAGFSTANRRNDGNLPAYYLDQFEVAVANYLRFNPGISPLLKDQEPQPNDAVRYVTFDEAMNCAEKMGKRLPTEAEYEFAATNGGKQPFPGADSATYLQADTWPFGAVGSPEFDRTRTQPPVFGLYSNVAEWTSSLFLPAPGRPDISWPGGTARMRVIRGGPLSVVSGNPDRAEFRRGPRFRVGQPQTNTWLPGVGFRGARSAMPALLPNE